MDERDARRGERGPGERTVRLALSALTPAERRRGLAIVTLMAAAAAFDVVGVAGVMPFLAVLAHPGLIESNAWLAWLYEAGGFAAPDRFLAALGLAAFALLVLSAAVRSVTFYVQNLFVQMCRHSLGSRLLEGYLRQPYEFFLNRHTGRMSNVILAEVDVFVDRALTPVAQMLTHGSVMVAMLLLLIAFDPWTALAVGSVVGGTYLLIFRATGYALRRSGIARAEANARRFELVGEALNGIKPIKVLGLESRYLARYRAPSEVVARTLAMSHLLAQLPRYAVETIAFGGIIVIAVALTLTRSVGDGSAAATVLPTLGLYAFASFRMLPAVQNVFHSLSSLRSAAAAVELIATELAAAPRAPLPTRGRAPLRLNRDLVLEGIGYRYSSAAEPGLSELSLTLPRGTSLGIVGTTGAGKTTLIDVILGLLLPEAGRILVDGLPIDESNRRNWQANLGYVPQEIFLSDGSVAANIALGLAPEEIDMARVETCARMARIHDFVSRDLPEGYATRVGERGLRLSGGQRQRIAIARALYRDPEVIIFDEATSALDSLTEAEVMEAIRPLSGRKTLIIIAHRLTTLEGCDQILRLERGRGTVLPRHQAFGERPAAWSG